MKKIITEHLKNLGVPANLCGYDYLREAIGLVISDKSYMCQITKLLYPDVAVKFKTTSVRVERGIRHAIERATENAPIEEGFKVFGNSMSASRGKPTNSEFIAGLADFIILEKLEDCGSDARDFV